MGKFQMTKQDVPVNQKKEGMDRRCAIYGCPRMGTLYSGNWNCRYHYGVSGERLAKVTARIKNHELEIDWYEHILQSTVVDYLMGEVDCSELQQTEGDKGNQWVKKRKLLILAPDGMQPLPQEEFSDYRKRMAKYIGTLLSPLTVNS